MPRLSLVAPPFRYSARRRFGMLIAPPSLPSLSLSSTRIVLLRRKGKSSIWQRRRKAYPLTPLPSAPNMIPLPQRRSSQPPFFTRLREVQRGKWTPGFDYSRSIEQDHLNSCGQFKYHKKLVQLTSLHTVPWYNIAVNLLGMYHTRTKTSREFCLSCLNFAFPTAATWMSVAGKGKSALSLSSKLVYEVRGCLERYMLHIKLSVFFESARNIYRPPTAIQGRGSWVAAFSHF